MDPHSQGPTARSRARSLGLGVAPASTVINVPTAARGMVAMTASHVRGPPLRMLRLVGPRDIGWYATAYVSRSSSDLEVQQWFDRRDRSLDGPPKGQITAVTSQIAASSLTQHGLPLGIRRL